MRTIPLARLVVGAALVPDTDPFREVGEKGKKGEMLRGM